MAALFSAQHHLLDRACAAQKTLVYGAIAGTILAGQPGQRLLGVVTWVYADGIADARALRCFFAMRAALAADANRLRQRFGVQPELRAALHLGEVIAGEVGQVRRQESSAKVHERRDVPAVAEGASFALSPCRACHVRTPDVWSAHCPNPISIY